MGSDYTCLQIFWTASKSLIYLDISCNNVQICFFFNLKTLTLSGSRKNTFTGLKTPQNCLFSSHLFFRQPWTKVFGHFCISGCFPIHTGPTPSLTPQTMLDACIQNFFPSFNSCIGWGRENCKKISKTLHCFKREPRNNRKIWILQYCPKDFFPGLSAMKSGQVREGKSNTAGSPFLPRRKESTAIAWSIAHQ